MESGETGENLQKPLESDETGKTGGSVKSVDLEDWWVRETGGSVKLADQRNRRPSENCCQ